MNENRYVLTADFGTQSIRVCIFNCVGEIKAIVKRMYDSPYFSAQPGYCEQDADYYWKEFVTAIQKLKKEAPNEFQKVEAMTVTTFRDSAVLLDVNNQPIRPMILWLDQRLAKAKQPLPKWKTLLFNVVGMTETAVMNRKRTMAIWYQENEPENWEKATHYVNISAYINYKLVGDLVDSCSSQTGHYPINFKKRKWYGEKALKNIYGIPKGKLCQLVMPGDTIGVISAACASKTGLPIGLPVIASGSDKGCETIGNGCIHPWQASISYGTASTIEVSNKHYHEPEQFLPAYPAAVPHLYNMEVQIYRGYWMVTWFGKEFGKKEIEKAKENHKTVEQYLDEKMKDVPAGSEGLILQPYWGPGLKKPKAKGAVIGWADYHSLAHFYRAIIEGIGYALREGLEGIEKSQRRKVKEIVVSGGGSQSDVVCQITADIFGLKVKKVQTIETSSLGGAIVTYLALGVYSNVEEAIEKMVHMEKTYEPDEKNHLLYNQLFERGYKKMYPQLKQIYSDIKEIVKK